jgi:hypothetical protein
VLILTALLVPALVVCGALAFGVTALWTGRQDLQRAADLGALAAATDVPSVSGQLPISGLKLFQRFDDPLHADDWHDRARAVVVDQFADGRSPVATAFQTTDGAPSAAVAWAWVSPLLASLRACAADVAELAGCKAGLDAELGATLPEVGTLDASAASAVAAVASALPPGDQVMSSQVATQLRDVCAHETGISIFGTVAWTCDATVGSLLGAVDHRNGSLLGTVTGTLRSLLAPIQHAATNGLLDPAAHGLGFDGANVPQLGVDVAGAAPALLTPRVSVDVHDLTMKPSLSPMTFSMTASATARRVIKSALVLPSVGMPGLPADGWSLLPASTQQMLLNRLGPNAPAMLGAAGTDGWLIDPNVLSASAPALAEKVLDLVDHTETAYSTKLSSALCKRLPPSVVCPIGDDIVDRQHLLGPFMEDVWDATRPPPQGTAPTVQEILAAHADSGEPLYVVGGLRPVRLGEIFGSLWPTIRSPHVGTTLGSALSELMFVPALDVVPAAVHREGTTFRLERVLATAGLYKARLVR